MLKDEHDILEIEDREQLFSKEYDKFVKPKQDILFKLLEDMAYSIESNPCKMKNTERGMLYLAIKNEEIINKLTESSRERLIDKYNNVIKPKEDLLLKLRGHLAYKKQVKPYVIFNNEALDSLLILQPKTLDELSSLKGFPREGARVNKWGEAIIAIFNQHEEIEDFNVELDSKGEANVSVVVKKMELF